MVALVQFELNTNLRCFDSKEDQAAAHFAELWNNKMFLEPAINGHFPEELEEVLKKMASSGKQNLKMLKFLKKIPLIS